MRTMIRTPKVIRRGIQRVQPILHILPSHICPNRHLNAVNHDSGSVHFDGTCACKKPYFEVIRIIFLKLTLGFTKRKTLGKDTGRTIRTEVDRSSEDLLQIRLPCHEFLTRSVVSLISIKAYASESSFNFLENTLAINQHYFSPILPDPCNSGGFSWWIPTGST